jgi:hypothetical protein
MSPISGGLMAARPAVLGPRLAGHRLQARARSRPVLRDLERHLYLYTPTNWRDHLYDWTI